MLINLVLLAIFVAVVAFTYSEGLWSNAILFFNVMTAALLAMNFWEPLAGWLDGMLHAFTYFWDFIAFWLVFAAALFVLRTITDRVSLVRVKFRKPVDLAGGAFFSCWTAWVVVSFALTTLHTAPLAEQFLGGTFQPTPEAKMFFGLGPDRSWLAFTQKLSQGALSQWNPRPFDPDADFILKYADRRAANEKNLGLTAK